MPAYPTDVQALKENMGIRTMTDGGMTKLEVFTKEAMGAIIGNLHNWNMPATGAAIKKKLFGRTLGSRETLTLEEVGRLATHFAVETLLQLEELKKFENEKQNTTNDTSSKQ